MLARVKLTMLVSVAVRLQFGVAAIRCRTEELADAEHHVERAGLLVDRIETIEQLLEFAVDGTANQTGEGGLVVDERLIRG